MADFQERTRYLSQMVGTGRITSRCYVNQAYAQIQHEELSFNHPGGGRAKYLQAPMFENLNDLMRTIADKAITPKGSDLGDAMIDVAEEMSNMVWENAPIDTGELYRSGNPIVLDKGVETYNRPPEIGRLSENDPRLGGQPRS